MGPVAPWNCERESDLRRAPPHTHTPTPSPSSLLPRRLTEQAGEGQQSRTAHTRLPGGWGRRCPLPGWGGSGWRRVVRTGEQSEAGVSKEGEREGPFRRLRRRPGQRRGEQRSPFSLEGGSRGEMAALVCRRLDRLPNTPQAVTADGEHNHLVPLTLKLAEGLGRSHGRGRSGSTSGPPKGPLHRVHEWDQKSL